MNHSSLESKTYSHVSPGSWRALWATMQDLKEAMVDPDIALQGVSEGLFASEDIPHLCTLFALYAEVQKASRTLGVGSFQDIASNVISWIPHSRLLPRFRRVCWYGFYDLTQVQLSVLEALARVAPVTIFFPLSDTPEFSFGRRFFERHLFKNSSPVRITPMGVGESISDTSQSHKPDMQIVSTVGPEDELNFICKETLILVETHGYRFDEIGLVARTLAPYRHVLKRTFDQNRVPFTTTATEEVLQEPVMKSVLQLARLPLTGYYWRTVLDVVASPFYRFEGVGTTREQTRPDIWELAVRSLGITRGEEEWARFASITKLDPCVTRFDELDSDHDHTVAIDGVQLKVFQRHVAELIADCQALPYQGSFQELTAAFTALLEKHLSIPGLTDEWNESNSERVERLVAHGTAMKHSLEELRQLDRVAGEINWEEWTRVFDRSVENARVMIGSDHHSGVRVLDAMSARGLPFRALFVLGLNEKVFPRVIREDAFLRDRHRRILEETLGYKIDEKLAGYDEERLLFALLKQAARDRLFLLYERADTEGRALAPSSYLREIHEGTFLGEKKQEFICATPIF